MFHVDNFRNRIWFILIISNFSFIINVYIKLTSVVDSFIILLEMRNVFMLHFLLGNPRCAGTTTLLISIVCLISLILNYCSDIDSITPFIVICIINFSHSVCYVIAGKYFSQFGICNCETTWVLHRIYFQIGFIFSFVVDRYVELLFTWTEQ